MERRAFGMALWNWLERIAKVRPGSKPSPASAEIGRSYHRPVLDETTGAARIEQALARPAPFLAARIGSAELACLSHYRDHRQGRLRRAYPKDVAFAMHNNAGVFPKGGRFLDRFAQYFLECIREVDLMGVWYMPDEDRIIREHCPDAELVALRSLEPYYLSRPWSARLRGRRVAVVHPFADSIREQYERRRERIFENPDVLPAFELTVVKAVQSIAGEVSGFATWFTALDAMRAALDRVDYEVLIVGADAHGLPLAAHARLSGRQAIHMGGATQVLFGIRGRRWDEHAVISRLFNDAWIRPRRSETPAQADRVEGGCYW